MRDAGGAGPSVKFGGAPFFDGQFGAWTGIGAEKTASGYAFAIKFGAADQFQVWNLDNNGNFVNAALGTVPGSNNGLRALEPSFQQDLNSDGTIGPPPPSAPTFSADAHPVLTGTPDNDTFVFDQAPGPGNVATIVDFAPGSDSIALSRAVFTEAGPAGGLEANAFFVGAAAHDANDRVIYDQASGHLMYDADGTGAQAAVTFAVLSTDLSLTEKDFILV
jgi:Ca2+-binding RTX toxin-like protein